jgi:hypothetical protein
MKKNKGHPRMPFLSFSQNFLRLVCIRCGFCKIFGENRKNWENFAKMEMFVI